MGEVYRLLPLNVPEADIGSLYRFEPSFTEDSRRTSPNNGRESYEGDFSHGSTAALIPRPASRELPSPPEEAYLVSFVLNDPRHPYNWSALKKWTVLIVVCSAAVCVTVASSIQASTYQNLEDEFDVLRIEAVAGVSLYVLGFGVGALFLGPLSEFYGRSIIYLVSFALFTIFNIPIATAQNMGILLFFRLITGLCGAGFLSVAGGTVSDMFRPGTTDLPTAIYTLAPLSGPCLGPILGGYMNQNVTWRATFYLIIAWGGVEFLLLWTLVPETFLPIVQKQEARRLRISTGEGAWTSPSEKSGRTVRDVFPAALWVPIKLMMSEKMALAMDTWTSLILGIIYLFFNAIPYTFRTLYNFSLGESGLAFLALGLGMVLGTATQPLFIARIKDKGIRAGTKPAPETRLPVGMAGAILAPVGLLWFALSSFRKMPWIMPMLGTLIFGVGSVYIFTCVFGFLVSTYPKYAASAMAGNTLLRCVWAAGFPLFALPMYQGLGPEGATGLLAGLCALLAPIPFVLARVGPRLRAKSEYAS
ncbi:MFS transporter [Cutaneotrichosporon oleaginosum]|uniref:MFS transporter n=1 Tax=Cutaneotrichosporon oleaginosum TaxID=879819 RepID=A0A0J1B3B7_9TREE|nr:MFS transporter [Cutaneotrichosporon oleaginosum]KLT42114.1 MFS transporter [Cutaneotrichosporon oleaginosum]TXT04647.1 hypothetical protein COLE_07466 [Cutaneotrichosporon oleaginosum]